MTTFNFGDTESAAKPSGGGVPAGDYVAKVTAIEEIFSSSGTHGIKTHFRVESVLKGADCVGNETNNVFWLSEKAAPYVKRDCETIIGKPITGEFDFASLRGKRVVIVVRPEKNPQRVKDNGEPFDVIVGFNELPAEQRDPLAGGAAAPAAFPWDDDTPA